MKKFCNWKKWLSICKKRESVKVPNEMLDAVVKMEEELKEILSILEEEISENKKMYWLLADKCSENRDLKYENKNLKNQLKNRKKEENENN